MTTRKCGQIVVKCCLNCPNKSHKNQSKEVIAKKSSSAQGLLSVLGELGRSLESSLFILVGI